MRYIWTIRHRRAGEWLTIAKDGQSFTLTPDLKKATHFDGNTLAAEAVQKLLLSWTPAARWSALDIQIVDQTIPDEPIPDADPAPVWPGRNELIASVMAAGEPRREAARKARALARLARAGRPSGVVVNKPPRAAPPAAKKTTARKKPVAKKVKKAARRK